MFDHPQRVAHLPERRRPEPDEQGAPLGVAALVLIDRLRPDPKADAQSDGAERASVEVRAAETAAMQCVDDHGAVVPVVSAFSPGSDGYREARVESPFSAATSLDGCDLADWDRVDVLALYVADDADASQRGARRPRRSSDQTDALADDDVQGVEAGV